MRRCWMQLAKTARVSADVFPPNESGWDRVCQVPTAPVPAASAPAAAFGNLGIKQNQQKQMQHGNLSYPMLWQGSNLYGKNPPDNFG